jgi:hypothetical protein
MAAEASSSQSVVTTEFLLRQEKDFRPKAGYSYMLCGWRTRSDIPLTSVPTCMRASKRVDVLIRLAFGRSPISKSAGGSVRVHLGERSLIRIEGVADFEVSGGQQIRIWPAAGAALKDIEIFLFGPVWATLCYQRGMFPLHASAIRTGEGITAFAGHSGVGKSTMAALLNSLDYELVADDILPVSFNRSSLPGAWPYLRRLKLRDDSIADLALSPMERVSETLDKEKYFVRPKYAGDDKWSRIERVYVIEISRTDSRVSIDRIVGTEAVHALIEQTYNYEFILKSGSFRTHLANCTQLASKVAIYRVRRSSSFDARKELGSIICAHFKNAPT